MLLTISTTHQPATDLGFLLHKHPDRIQNFRLTFGEAHVFYPDAGNEHCTAALLLDVDPIRLTRGRRTSHGSGFPLYPYVNDRPYAASSFLGVAIAEVFGTALSGRCNTRPELVDTPLPLHARIAVLPCRGGRDLLQRLFEPLGYDITAEQHPLDARFPEWGASDYFTVDLRNTIPLRDLLAHIYLLVPVLDDNKHYWVGEDEIGKLLRHGERWLAHHPERELITRRYLRHQRALTRTALAQLNDGDTLDPDQRETDHDREEREMEKAIGLNQQRLDAVLMMIRESGAGRVLDLGCGEGRLLQLLLPETQFTRIVGMDVSYRSLSIAAERLQLDRLPEMLRSRMELMQGSLIYRDRRLQGFDAAAVVEVIEHLDPFRLEAFERVLFEFARPGTIVLTTPNREYNVRWPSLPAGNFRHHDHRFEWSREEFKEWGDRVGARYGYHVRYLPVGDVDPELGSPTQMGVFNR